LDISGLQTINKVGKVIVTKGAKEIYRLTSKEKAETVIIVASCSVEGNFLI
jgi:hypothetical protein